MIFVGDDWAEDHHDVQVMDEAGMQLAWQRLPEGLPGIGKLHELIASYAEEPDQVVIGIETDRGLWVQALSAAGYQVFAINPLAVARYRDRHHVSGAKSDASDAKLLADLVRTDRHNHRAIAGDSDQAEAIKVLARAHQNLIWTRTQQTSRLRSALREYYPAALEAFEDLAHGDALGVLDRAPTPEQAARMSLPMLQSALKRGGRQRYLAARAREIQAALRTEQLAAPAPVVAAFAASTHAAVGIIAELNRQIGELETSLAAHNAKSRKNYAGTSPLTIASGKKRAVLARYARNDRLYDAIDRWAFCALTTSPGARAFYDQHRDAKDTHHQALRALGNRLVGVLHGGLRHHTPTTNTQPGHIAWPPLDT